MKFVISGYYGFINLGDEAILQKIILDLKNNFKNSKITAFSANPSYTKEVFGVESVKNSIIKNFFILIREIIRCDCFILGGGGMLSDWQKSSPILWLTLPIFSILFRKKTIIYCVGVNPFRTLYGKLLLRFVLNHSSLIIVRDNYSKYCLTNAIGHKSKIYVTIDPVIVLNIPGNDFFKNYSNKRSEINKLSSKKSKIGICPSVFFHTQKLWPNSMKRFKKLKVDFSKLIKFLINTYDANIFLIPQSMKYDKAFCLNIYKLLDKECKSQTFIIENLNKPADFIDTLSHMDFAIGMRFHSIILSINLAVPFVGIIYGKKSKCLLEKIDYLDNSIIISDGFHEKNSDMDINKIKNIIMKVWNNKYQIEKDLTKKKKILKEIEKKNIKLLKEVIYNN